eukprot:TRINITY_DN6419_c0_g2_i1.p1 TRINITY_DN6419_c0_g2~~TRINITY_DN6419_c0_g2_i1.p1  ORF type:complete len:376 (+),score=101.00 TRINITY_DN6419_c0_g2_i1:218-1345(+)
MSSQDGRLRKSEISTDDPEDVFEMLDIIGEGAYGLICTCKNVLQDQIYAIKFLEIEEEDEENLQKEIDILKESSDCPYIVKYFGCYIKDTTLMIVMEFCNGGSALDIMTSCKRTISEEQISIIVSHMVQGLSYLHSHRILHRDLKAGNVLLTSDGRAKLADFGVSAKLVHTLQKKNTIVGSPYWMAPEVISVQKGKGEGYDFKADIWSLAITAIELAEGKPPLFDIASLRVIFLIPARPPPTMTEPQRWSSEFNDFLSVCLQKDPNKRPSASSLLGHPFVQRGLNKEHIIKDLVKACMPDLLAAREKKKSTKNSDGDPDSEKDEGGSTFQRGTRITINTASGTWSSRGTTVLNDIEGNTMEIKNMSDVEEDDDEE